MDASPAVVDVVFEERYWYPDDGGIVWIAGYQLVEAGSGRYLGRAALEVAAARPDGARAARGVHAAGVAGARAHHGEALAAADAGPGRPLALRRDAENPHDANAI